MLVLTRHDVESLLDLRQMLDVLEQGFAAYSSGNASAPPRSAARAPSGLLGSMPGWVMGHGFALKAVTVFPDNTSLPSHQGLIVLFDDVDGRLLCVMDGEHITAMRTGGAAAVAVRLLARDDARVLAIIGAGTQGHSHLRTVPLVRDFGEIRIASRTPEHAARLATEDARCRVSESFEAAVRDADVVCCCTDSRTPVLEHEWVSPGTHVTSVGGTFGPEVARELVQDSRVFVEWRGAATSAPPAGAHELQGIDPAALTELGEVISGIRSGRQRSDEITLYKSTGSAFEDTVVARMVYEAAVARGTGTHIDL